MCPLLISPFYSFFPIYYFTLESCLSPAWSVLWPVRPVAGCPGVAWSALVLLGAPGSAQAYRRQAQESASSTVPGRFLLPALWEQLWNLTCNTCYWSSHWKKEIKDRWHRAFLRPHLQIYSMDQGKHTGLNTESFRYNLWVKIKKQCKQVMDSEKSHTHTHTRTQFLPSPGIFKHYQLSGLFPLALTSTRLAFLPLSVSHLVFHEICQIQFSASQGKGANHWHGAALPS